MEISTNILNTIKAGLTIFKKLFELGERTGSAGLEASQLATEISLICSTLRQIQSSFLQGDGGRYSIGAVALIQKILDRCQEIYDELDAILKRINAGFGRTEDLILRVRCESEKTEVKILKGTLEACNITLHLIQHNLTIAKKATSRRYASYSYL